MSENDFTKYTSAGGHPSAVEVEHEIVKLRAEVERLTAQVREARAFVERAANAQAWSLLRDDARAWLAANPEEK